MDMGITLVIALHGPELAPPDASALFCDFAPVASSHQLPSSPLFCCGPFGTHFSLLPVELAPAPGMELRVKQTQRVRVRSSQSGTALALLSLFFLDLDLPTETLDSSFVK